MIKTACIIILTTIFFNVNGTNYSVTPGTYMSASPSTGIACLSINAYSISLQSTYFTYVGKTVIYFTSQEFGGKDNSGTAIQYGNDAFATAITANSYTGIENDGSFYYGSMSTGFGLIYDPSIIYEPVVTTRTVAMNTFSQKDSIRLSFPVTININNFNATGSTANTTIGSTSCLTISWTNPCKYIIPQTNLEITLPTTPNPNNPSTNITPLSAFNSSTCNVSINGQSPSSRTCIVNGDVLTVSNLISNYLATQSISLVICNIVRADPNSGSPKLRFVNTNYASPSNRYAQASFTY